MGTAQLGEEPNAMINVTSQPTSERSEARRRLHLRDITNDTPQQSDSVGAELRAARTRRSEDLRSIAQVLRIRRELLEALEEGRGDALPGRAYAIGFVRSYAEYLGLDPADIVARFKAELDFNEKAGDELAFPDVPQETRLPRGTFLIVGVVVAVGIYGGWLLSHSADRMMAERVPPVPERIEARSASAVSEDERPNGGSLSGDPASAATRPYGGGERGQAGAPETGEQAASQVYAVPVSPAPVAEGDVAASGTPAQIASLDPQSAAMPAGIGAAPADVAPALPPLPAGQAFGTENFDGRVVVRARKSDAWIRVEDAEGHVLIERTLALGDSYRAPAKPGVILVARDASAFEILVDGASLGLAGPPTLVLTGKSLAAADLIAALPKPVAMEAAVAGETAAGEATAVPAP